jgi:hypothetical protein
MQTMTEPARPASPNPKSQVSSLKSEAGKLIVQDDGAGLRHYLDGKRVQCGTQLQIRIRKSTLMPCPGQDCWAWARYEAAIGPDFIRPILYTCFGRVTPDETTELRWGGAQ